MQRCCPGASTASRSRRSSLSSPSEMWRPLLLGLQRRRAAAGRLPPSKLLDGFSSVRAISSSSPSTSSTSPPPPPPPLAPLPAALARARARASTADLTFHVAGVSFEGRQRAASALHKNQPLALRRERRNEFDPRAVAVETLDGRERIGYVPRSETEKVLPGDAEDAAFAFVRSVGRAHLKEEEGEVGEEEQRRGREGRGEGQGGNEGNEGEGEEEQEREELRMGPWGVSVAVKPLLPPLEIDALPRAIAEAGPLSSALPEREWRRLAKEAAVASGFRCAVTGGVGGGGERVAVVTGEEEEEEGKNADESSRRCAPVEAHEHWRFDDEGRVATLLAVRALCPEAHDVAVSFF